MKTGMFRLPHTTLKRPALIWYNRKDTDLQEAFKTLNSHMHGIKTLVIVTKPLDANYSTKQLIDWFMSQKFDRNVSHTTKLREDGRAVNKAYRRSRQRRNYIDHLIIKVEYEKIAGHPKDYYRMYLLTPQMHIFPSNYTDNNQTSNTYLMVDSWGTGYASASSDYDYYKSIMEQVMGTWSPAVPVNRPKDNSVKEYPLYLSLCQAYELDPEDEHAIEQLDYYIISKEPIVRMPKDEEVYGFFIKLGIAPAFSDIESGTSIYDEAQFEQFGKEAMIDELRDFRAEDLLPDFY